jgi:hypothetical protein
MFSAKETMAQTPAARISKRQFRVKQEHDAVTDLPCRETVWERETGGCSHMERNLDGKRTHSGRLPHETETGHDDNDQSR